MRPFALLAVLKVVTAGAAAEVPFLSAPVWGSPTPLPSAQPSREPRDLAQLPQEETVLRAFQTAGISIQTIGGSKFADALGAIRPARVFIADAGNRGADILFVYAVPPDPTSAQRRARPATFGTRPR
jgi:hypothetical protein